MRSHPEKSSSAKYRKAVCLVFNRCISGNRNRGQGVGAGFQRLIPTGERSGSLTPTAATESVSLCTRMKSNRVCGTGLGGSILQNAQRIAERVKQGSTNCRAAGIRSVDYVTRRFNASSAGLKKPVGLDLR